MKTFKKLTVVSVLVLGMTGSVFASWWNPFTWNIFKKKETQKEQQIVTNTVLAASSTLQNTQKNDLKTYINSNFKYSIDYPLNWIIEPEKRIIDETNKIESLVKIYDVSREHGIVVTVDQKEYPLLSEAPVKEKIVINGILQTVYIFPEGYECLMRDPERKDCSFFTVPIYHNGLWYSIKIIGEAKTVSEAHKMIISSFKFTK